MDIIVSKENILCNMSDIQMQIAQQYAASFEASGTTKTPWDHFEYVIRLVLSRWTALRMAMEGQWGGGDLVRKYEILLDEISNLFKYQKIVYADDLALNISEYIEEQFGLICEDNSVEEVSELLVSLAEECKKGDYTRVFTIEAATKAMFPINLKSAKKKIEDGTRNQYVQDENEEMQGQEQEASTNNIPEVDADGFVTVRRSSRRKVPTKVYDPAAQFPGAQ